MTVAPGRLVIAFDHPHRIGSVCLPPCKQCGESPGNTGDICGADAMPITEDIPALAILREATRAEYEAFCDETGAVKPYAPLDCFYYIVTAD